MPDWSDDAPWPDGCTLFIPFQDPENVGAVIRSAAAFGVARVVLLKEAAHPFHPRSSRAAGSALFQVPLYQGPSIRNRSSRKPPRSSRWIPRVRSWATRPSPSLRPGRGRGGSRPARAPAPGAAATDRHRAVGRVAQCRDVGGRCALRLVEAVDAAERE